MGSTFFLMFSYPNLLFFLFSFFFFLNLFISGTCIIFFSQVLGLSLGFFNILFYFIFLYLLILVYSL